MAPIKVLIVDDHELVRAGIRAVIARAAPALRVVGEAANGEEALDATARLQPDVTLLDYRLPGISGAATCEESRRRWPGTAVVFLTNYLDDEVIYSCLMAGANGYLVKDSSESRLVQGIIDAAAELTTLSPLVAGTLVRWIRQTRPLDAASGPLSPIERRVLTLVAEGLSNGAIADRLNLSIHSVKASVGSLMAKLGVRKRSEAAAVGVRKGLI